MLVRNGLRTLFIIFWNHAALFFHPKRKLLYSYTSNGVRKAVYILYYPSSGICQNPLQRSIRENICTLRFLRLSRRSLALEKEKCPFGYSRSGNQYTDLSSLGARVIGEAKVDTDGRNIPASIFWISFFNQSFLFA